MSFKDVIGHSMVIEMIQRAIGQDRVSHSYLFLGKEGVGRKKVALQFAKALNCLEKMPGKADACDHCTSCRKIDHANHPDVLLIEPEGQTLKVDRVRQMQQDLVYRPYEGRRRVCILDAADQMASNMSNTLLKILEEPPLHSVIILLAKNPRLLLPTILSRCQHMRFHPLSIQSVSEWLIEQKGLDEEQAHLLASLSEGSPGKALEIKEQVEEIPREDLLNDWVGRKSIAFEKKESWAESFSTRRESLILLLEITRTLLRDLVVLKSLKERSRLIHTDLFEPLKRMASEWTVPSLLKRMEVLHGTILALRANANVPLALDAMRISWVEG